MTVENVGSAELSITSLTVELDGVVKEIIDLLLTTVISPGEVIEIYPTFSTDQYDDAVDARVAVEAEGPCDSLIEASAGSTIPLCTLGEMDIEVSPSEDNHGIEVVGGTTLLVSVANTGVTEFTFSEPKVSAPMPQATPKR